tara:strand:+ start:1906 stop:2364 length:459 start_codon:yes stop_codon:yes gene_type:complete
MQSYDSRKLLRNSNETIAFGQEIPILFPELKILLLEGPLGAGKTCLVKGIAVSLGIEEAITSPTFSLSNIYTDGTKPLIHMDLYRLEKKKEANELFIENEEEAINLNALLVIEWPERLGLSIENTCKVKLHYAKNYTRKVEMVNPYFFNKNL